MDEAPLDTEAIHQEPAAVPSTSGANYEDETNSNLAVAVPAGAPAGPFFVAEEDDEEEKYGLACEDPELRWN